MWLGEYATIILAALHFERMCIVLFEALKNIVELFTME